MTSDMPIEPGRFAYEGLDRVIHEKARLGILTSLLTYPEGILFTELKQLCSLTDGNLSRHLQVLVEEDLVEMWKGYRNRKPQTLCRLTPNGREKFLAYLSELEQVLRDASSDTEQTESRKGILTDGWVEA